MHQSKVISPCYKRQTNVNGTKNTEFRKRAIVSYGWCTFWSRPLYWRISVDSTSVFDFISNILLKTCAYNVPLDMIKWGSNGSLNWVDFYVHPILWKDLFSCKLFLNHKTSITTKEFFSIELALQLNDLCASFHYIMNGYTIVHNAQTYES